MIIEKEGEEKGEEKGDPPPLPEESLRSTKKVRIQANGEEEGEGCKDTVADVIMEEQGASGGISYRNKLLNLDSKGRDRRDVEEVVITEADFQITREGDIPSIEFSKEVRDVLAKGMEKTLVIKLLGRSITYGDLLNRTQAIWQVKGFYQLVDVGGGFFFATFDLAEDYLKVLTGGPWVIFGLSFRYYHKSTLRAIGKLLGEVVKIDYRKETRGRGRYARIAILVDLQQPLVPWIKVDGKAYGVEYEEAAITTQAIKENIAGINERIIMVDGVGPVIDHRASSRGTSDLHVRVSTQQGRPKPKGGKPSPVKEYRKKAPSNGPGAQSPPQSATVSLAQSISSVAIKGDSVEGMNPSGVSPCSILPQDGCSTDPIVSNMALATIFATSYI
ncbi:hypothetical protein K1719_013395 [Acacia pycnantha]|nr:hypothetical protein K1719_013395 [Acacia pycnantha]